LFLFHIKSVGFQEDHAKLPNDLTDEEARWTMKPELNSTLGGRIMETRDARSTFAQATERFGEGNIPEYVLIKK
jgi:hypothetical protein